MKKIILVTAVIILALTSCLVMTSCAKDSIKIMVEGFAGIETATGATHQVTVMAGEQQIYVLQQNYAVNGDGVTVTGSEQKLNPDFLTQDDKYVTEEISKQITKQQMLESLPVTLNLTKECIVELSDKFVVNSEADKYTLSFELAQASVAEFLNISAEEASTISNVFVTLTVTGKVGTNYQVSYNTANGNAVTVTYTITY